MDISWPTFLGSPAQVGTFVVVFVAAMRMVIPWRQQNITIRDTAYKALKERVDELQGRLDTCEKACRTRDETILGMRKQSTAQQISFARLLMKALGQENPELQHMLTTLQDIEKDLEEPIFLEGNTDEPRS